MKTLLVLAAIVALAPACARTTPNAVHPTPGPAPTTVSEADAPPSPECKEIARLDGQPMRCQAVPPAALRR